MTEELLERAKALYPKEAERSIYLRGIRDAEKYLSGGNKDFLTELATKLRLLWPPGEKDGKYPWRESVSATTERLDFLWKERGLKDKYTLDQCLIAARRYLAQFQDNAKYMQTLKYFICKQTKIVGKNGKITYITKSVFADMLENSSSFDTTEEWAEIFESNSTMPIQQGELI